MRYDLTVQELTPEMLTGFFVGWPNPPNVQTHLKMLKNSSYIVLAIDNEENMVVGFITAISDDVLSAYIPFLEVLPEYQHKGIGRELVERMLKQLEGLYMIDLICDDKLESFYSSFQMTKSLAMIKRNYNRQSGL
ncbi:GNAT family N-acetyltransferase [Salipaludibacillus daqingensis]|uniref:GNAT family N-acetyltransferase n=1 Tax=Salipaludibacillus daqingensis TaxID=3041001 RepID=UPI0024762EF0|nr:GNAT family N-acetyltransferase [Salipaludibacillus daqingensis]